MKKILGCLHFVVLGLASSVWAEEQYLSTLFQNDFFLGHDGGGYTNGLYVAGINAPSFGDQEVDPSFLLHPLAPILGLSGATLTAWSFGQIMVTPRDISRSEPDSSDVPYAGALVFRTAQVYAHEGVAEILAIDIGVIGPASGAAQTQRFVHRLTGSDQPQGWGTQVSNKISLGLERYRAWRFSSNNAEPGKTGGDLLMLGGGLLSNLESSAGMGVVVRYGTGLEKSFPAATKLTLHGADPILLGRDWFVFASLSADRLFNYVGVGSDAPPGNNAQLRKVRVLNTVGLAYGWERASIAFSIQNVSPVVESSSRQTYGSLTYTYHLK